MKVISFGSDVCQDMGRALKKEWLEANRFGGFAGSTVPLINTRRYHGLLNASLRPPLGSYVLLSGLDEVLHVDDLSIPLSSRIYRGTVFPEGYRYIDQFSLMPFPTWIFLIEDLILERTLYFLHDEQTVLIRYQILAGDENMVRLELKPITAFRQVNELLRTGRQLKTEVQMRPANVQYAGLHFHHNAAVVDQTGTWYRGIQYPEDKKLGLDFEEDLYSPFRMVYAFGLRRENFLAVSVGEQEAIRFRHAMRLEAGRRHQMIRKIRTTNPTFKTLAYFSHAFVINPEEPDNASGEVNGREESVGNILKDSEKASDIVSTGGSDLTDCGKQIVPAYPFSGERMTQSLLAFHGLTLTSGRQETAKSVLIHLTKRLGERFLSAGPKPLEAEECPEAPLWLVNSVYDYVNFTEDLDTLAKELFPTLKSLIETYLDPARPSLHLAADGLLLLSKKKVEPRAGEKALRHNRFGKAVDVQALWYNALRAMTFFSEKLEKPSLANIYEQMGSKCKRSFNRVFWNEASGCLYDCLGDRKKGAEIKPNQILALGLSFPILSDIPERWRSVMKVVRKELLTPYGLRGAEHGVCGYEYGSSLEVDDKKKAHHKGHVWPWFLVPYALAVLRAEGDSEKAREDLFKYVRPLREHLDDVCVGFVSEVFDARKPHAPLGTTARADTVGAFLQLYEILAGMTATSEKIPSLNNK